MESSERQTYETPALIDYGTVDEVTKGTLAVNKGDFPIGAVNFTAVQGPGGSSNIN